MRRYGDGLGIDTVEGRDLGHHSHLRCLLIFSSVHREDVRSSDGVIENRSESFLARDLFASERPVECSLDIIYVFAQSRFDIGRYGVRKIQIFFHADSNHIHLPLRACHIEEIPVDIYDILTSPFHGELIFRWMFCVVGHLCDIGSLQIIFFDQLHDIVVIFRSDDDRHPLLRFGDR